MILNIGKAVDCLPDEVGLDTDIYVQALVDIGCVICRIAFAFSDYQGNESEL